MLNQAPKMSASEAAWLEAALVALIGLKIPYWVDSQGGARITASSPYTGVYSLGPRGFAVCVTLAYSKQPGVYRTVETVLEAQEVARLTMLPLPADCSKWK